MKIGTKSVLYGAHCFFIHPVFVFIAWWKLYGFPWDPRLWVAFFVHDLGYWGKPNMDGEEGETHPELGAIIMHKLFDRRDLIITLSKSGSKLWNGGIYESYSGRHFQITKSTRCKWYRFCYYHSRFLAKKDGRPYSKLCVADKLAVSIEPWWLYLPRVKMTGEIHEYRKLAAKREGDGENISKYQSMLLNNESELLWLKGMKSYLKAWAYEHRDLKEDTWTPEQKQAVNKEGVWQ